LDTLNRSRAAGRRGLLVRIAPAILSGVLISLAFPPAGWWWLAWVALAPLYLALTAAPEGGRGAIAHGLAVGFAFGFVLFLVGMFWMNEIGALPWFVLAIIQALPFTLWAGALALLLPRLPAAARPFTFAATWVLLEWLRGVGSYAFPWFPLAATQVHALPLVQIIAITAQWGLSFALTAVSGLAGEVVRTIRSGEKKGAFLWAGAAVAIPLLLAAYGWGALHAEGSRAATATARCSVAVAQGSFLKASRFNTDARAEPLNIYLDLTRKAVALGGGRVDLVLWPETVVPDDLLRSGYTYPRISALARDTNASLLVGTIYQEDPTHTYNSAVLVKRDGKFGGRYDKAILVPVGEFFPLRGLLGPIYARYGVPDDDLAPGSREGGPLTFPYGPDGATSRVGILICYESAFPWRSREEVRRGAQLLSLLTSDQTFGTSAGPYQHADLAILRAVENRRWLVRAASTGTSQIIDPTGRIRDALPVMSRDASLDVVELREDQTLATRWGDWFVAVCAVIAAASVVRAFRGKEPPTAGALPPG
jgi:apolipoprotein N-acyltransferase